MSDAARYLDYLVREIHTAIVATVDDDGRPVTCAADMMGSDGESLYFLTARGKGFYNRLKAREYLSLTAVKGESTMTSAAISVSGRVRELGAEKIPELIEKNPYMREIYPSEASRAALTAFQIYEGTGEWFDLSKKPIQRASFAFGGQRPREEGFFITDACIGCGECAAVCPQGCIRTGGVPYVIEQDHCLRCGMCESECPTGAVKRR